ncbi:hypothetical protein [Candidatus Lokiarchaeum ossiferum]|uniref:hypothetical protein n=1 Tax=Candidatus Lokiarchaeum ossiferum TaxID=2951803 RepID=UPI00352C9E9F
MDSFAKTHYLMHLEFFNFSLQSIKQLEEKALNFLKFALIFSGFIEGGFLISILTDLEISLKFYYYIAPSLALIAFLFCVCNIARIIRPYQYQTPALIYPQIKSPNKVQFCMNLDKIINPTDNNKEIKMINAELDEKKKDHLYEGRTAILQTSIADCESIIIKHDRTMKWVEKCFYLETGFFAIAFLMIFVDIFVLSL